MAKKQGSDDGRDDEINALLGVEDIDTESIAKQINQRNGVTDDPPLTDPPPTDPPPTDPPTIDPPPTDKKIEVPDTKVIVDTRLKEIFGESFTSAEELKKADIPGQLKELVTLRQKNQDLETQVKAKPKHAFASDDLAKLNEFVRETGINDATVFSKLNAADLTNMDNMDALILQYVIDNPQHAGKEHTVRKYFETKYDVDPAKVEKEELTQEELDVNKLGLDSDGGKAKLKLQELKGKIKMPEPLEEEIPPESTKKWTPEVESEKKSGWTTVNEKMGEQFAKLPIRIKGGTEPIVNFDISEEARKPILQNALDYVVSNQLEINEVNVKAVANMMYSDLIMQNFDQITHAVFERARSMTEEEALKLYHNPSERNTDTPPSGSTPQTEDERKEAAFQAELDR